MVDKTKQLKFIHNKIKYKDLKSNFINKNGPKLEFIKYSYKLPQVLFIL